MTLTIERSQIANIDLRVFFAPQGAVTTATAAAYLSDAVTVEEEAAWERAFRSPKFLARAAQARERIAKGDITELRVQDL